MRKLLREDVFGLDGERVAVNDEQGPRHPVGLEEALQERGCCARLAGSGRHLNEELAAAIDDFPAQGLDTGDLKSPSAASGNPPVNRRVEGAAPDLLRGPATRKGVLAKDGLNLPKMGVLVLVAEPDLLAIREEDVRHRELVGVATALYFALAEVDA